MSSTNYNLNIASGEKKNTSTWPALRKLIDLLPDQKGRLYLALVIMIIYAGFQYKPMPLSVGDIRAAAETTIEINPRR